MDNGGTVWCGFFCPLRRHTDDSAVTNAKKLDSPRSIKREPWSTIARSMLLANRNENNENIFRGIIWNLKLFLFGKMIEIKM